MTWRRWLAATGDGITIIVGIVLLSVIGFRYLAPADNSPELDIRLDRSLGIDWTESRATLIVALQSDCAYCRESMPFYRRLMEHDNDAVQIVVTAPPSDAGIADFLAEERVQPEALLYLEPGLLPVSGTPTLLLVDSAGVVTHAWIGLLNAAREREVLDAIS